MNFAQKLPGYVSGGALQFDAVVAVGPRDLTLFARAGILFLAPWRGFWGKSAGSVS